MRPAQFLEQEALEIVVSKSKDDGGETGHNIAAKTHYSQKSKFDLLGEEVGASVFVAEGHLEFFGEVEELGDGGES